MIDTQHYVYKKEIDWSTLHQGVSIPISIQVVFQQNMERFLRRGESKDIYLIIEEKQYKAKLVNQNFNAEKYPGRTDIIQIRYNVQSEIACRIREIFNASYKYFQHQKNEITDGKKRIFKPPEERKEYLAIYTTEYPDTYYVECITNKENELMRESMKIINEEELEYSINYKDPSATVQQMEQLVKIRKLNRSIGENLKLLYNNQCQICGTDYGKRYDANITEAHHIDPFVTSFNNDASNLLIICPNHHSVIHKARPEFKKQQYIFIYNNGVEEKLVLNKHL